jgi:glycosyltransferase A (GT-A) superfamily protein (DUF2064 family)
MTTALAIFVKTPGHSPVKTRLATVIGTENAVAFHRLAAQAVAEVACAVRDQDAGFRPYWAIAERDALGDPAWQDLPGIWQGEGTLGQRLDHVYGNLRTQHARVLLVGADVPQLTPALLREATAALTDPAAPFVMGEAGDGGFWLFGGRMPIARGTWCGVVYSRADTAAQLRAALASCGGIASLPALVDVDDAADLDPVAGALATLPAPLPAQRTLSQWLASLQRQTCPA